MYNVIFSPQWIFDRCLEGTTFSEFMHLPTAIFIGLLQFWFLTRVNHVKSRIAVVVKILISVVTGIFSFLVLPFIFLIIGFGLLNCDAWNQFYPGIDAAHGLHARIKIQLQERKTVPKNIEEVAALDSELYKKMIQNAKVTYIYDPSSNRYTLFVRPSMHYVAVFDSNLDYQLLRINNFSNNSGWDEFPNYPPTTKGPWDQLPK